MVEYGGDEQEVLEIVKHVLSKVDHNKAIIHFPGFSAFKNIMPEKQRRGFIGTVKILSSEMFFGQIKEYFLERLPKSKAEKLKEQLSSLDTPSLTRFLLVPSKEIQKSRLNSKEFCPYPSRIMGQISSET